MDQQHKQVPVQIEPEAHIVEQDIHSADTKTPGTTEPQQPETVLGDEVTSPRCTRMLENSMQCPRYAAWTTKGVKDNNHAICSVCKSLLGNPPEFSEPVQRKAGL